MTPLPRWATEAATWPLAFAQVREDAALDLEIADRLPAGASVVMVASGGCTVAALARHPRIARLHLVDPNPAQLAISRLKLRLLEAPLPDRLRILGHAPMDPDERLRALERIELGPRDVVATRGPDHAGRYERTFEALRELLGPRRDARSLDAAFRKVMSLPILVHLFGAAATGNRRRDFADHFSERTRLALQRTDPNPYLSQVLLGRYPEGVYTPWLSLPPGRATARIEETAGMMQDVLDASPGAFDFVHASNILDWLEESEARRLLDSAARALRPGGWILVRQLNSTLDIRRLGGGFTWDEATSADFLERDRSYFYSAIHAGVRR